MSLKDLQPPIAKKKNSTLTYHGINFNDDYAWLRDPAWQTAQDGVKDPQVMDYIVAENKYTEGYYQPLQPLIQKLLKERKAFVAEADQSVPIKIDDWFYYSRQAATQNYRVFCRRFQSMSASEEILFDQNQEAQGHKFFKLGMIKVNPNHLLMAYSIDNNGNEYFTVKIRDLTTKKELSDKIADVSGSVVWSPDGSGFYYVRLAAEWRAKTLCYHVLGSSSQQDTVLYTENSETATISISQSADKRYLFMVSGTKQDDAIHYIDLNAPEAKLETLASRQPNRHLSAEHYKGHFYFLTNDTGSNYRLVRMPIQDFSSGFEEVLGHNDHVYLTGLASYKQGLVLETREKGLDRIAILNEHDFSLRYLSMPDASYDLSLSSTSYNDEKIRLTYSSLAKPETTYAASFTDLSLESLKVEFTPKDFDSSKLQTERLLIKARDGVEVSVSLVYRHDLFKRNGDNPLLLYGYGAYGHSVPACFRPSIISLLDRGFVYAIAHIRGGDDLGYQWYLDGKLDKKWNTFNDFIDVGEALANQNYTTKGNISAMGGSAGGMLMGVVANERPDLFKSIIAMVPFVDVMNTMLDDKLPLTPGEFPEWGNPGKEPKAFAYIMGYSPYENVKKQAYPAILATGGLTDPRVTYWEMTKWVAKLREHNTSNNTILLNMNMSAGHGGGSARDDQFKEYCEAFAFLLNEHDIRK